MSASDSRPTGTLRKKIHRHPTESVSSPPSVGPSAGATTTAIPYTANAMPRCFGANVSARMDCSLGASPPPPAPCSTRKKTSHPSDVAVPHRDELAVKSATHVM